MTTVVLQVNHLKCEHRCDPLGVDLYATARGVYELHPNGQKVGDDVLSTGWTDYDKRIQYQTHDVTEMLAEGRNALGGILGNGWYTGFVGMDPKPESDYPLEQAEGIKHLRLEDGEAVGSGRYKFVGSVG